MKGLRKYLLGGLVGAIIGFLIAPKRAQKVRDALLGREPAPALPEQLMRSLPPGLFSPPSAGEERFSQPVEEARPEPAAVPVVAPLPAAAVVPDIVEPPSAELDEVEILYPLETEARPSPPPPETVEEEPVPLLPVDLREVEVEAQPQEIPTAPFLEAEPQETLVEPPSSEAEAPELTAEVGEEAIPAPLLLAPDPMPFAAAVPDIVAPPSAELDEVEILYPPETEARPSPPPPETVEEEPVPLLPVDLREVEVEAQPQEIPTAPFLEAEPQETLVEPPSSEAEAPELTAEVGEEGIPEPVSEPLPRSAVETDLRARIEETRRRIREEMERPFRIAEESAEEPAARESLPALSSEAPRRPVEPVAPPTPVLAPSQAEGPPPSLLGQAKAGDGEFDYEAMRRRIEETRSRLKAKAFDALMSGETSLLAHGKSAADGSGGGTHLSLDDDVDQSIESGLSAEDT